MIKNKPNLTLNMNDKIYLAVAKNFTEKFAYVYTLACVYNKKQNNYDMGATPQIHTFKDKSVAHMYHDTIEQLVIMNENFKDYKILFDFNQGLLERFRQQTNEYNK